MEPHEHQDDRAADDLESLANQDRTQSYRGGMGHVRDNAVADLAGEFGAELVRAIRVGLAQGHGSAHGSRGSSKVSWYAFATEYARVHWPERAAKTRDEVSDALTAITLAMLWDIPGRPTRNCCAVPCATAAGAAGGGSAGFAEGVGGGVVGEDAASADGDDGVSTGPNTRRPPRTPG